MVRQIQIDRFKQAESDKDRYIQIFRQTEKYRQIKKNIESRGYSWSVLGEERTVGRNPY